MGLSRVRWTESSVKELELGDAERHVLFGSSVSWIDSHSGFVKQPQRTESLLRALNSVHDREKAAWLLLEDLRMRVGEPVLLNSKLLLLKRGEPAWLVLGIPSGEWFQVHGEIDPKKVQRVLALWGVLQHSRFEEFRRFRGDL